LMFDGFSGQWSTGLVGRKLDLLWICQL